MKKVAKLVTVSFVTRVIVDENASDNDILLEAIPRFLNKFENEIHENLESIVDDLECPYNEEEGNQLTAAEVKLLKEASGLLCANDDEDLVQMVRAIISYEDKYEIIDFIDGVQTWEKVEFSLTVRQFLKEVGYTGIEFKD